MWDDPTTYSSKVTLNSPTAIEGVDNSGFEWALIAQGEGLGIMAIGQGGSMEKAAFIPLDTIVQWAKENGHV